MAPRRIPITRPVVPPPPVIKPVVKPPKPVNPLTVKTPAAANGKTAEFNLTGQATKAALFKKLDSPKALPNGTPPTPIAPKPGSPQFIGPVAPSASRPAPTQFIGPVPPTAGNVPAAPGQLSLTESKGVSGAAYEAKNVGEVYRFGDGSQWRVDKVQDSQGFFDTGFKAVAMRRVIGDSVTGFKNDPTDNRVAVGFAGTDGLNDINDDIDQGTGALVIPEQYKQGLAFTAELRNEAARSCETVTATGHSLGGGIASYVSTKTGIPATAINSAPLAVSNYSGRASSYENQITQYHNNSEFLTRMDNVNPLDARPGRDVVVSEKDVPEEAKWYNSPIVDTKNDLLSLTNHKLGNTAVEIGEAVRIYP